MSLFPLVQDPCPYKGPITDILAGDQCRLCQREVHDLTLMSEAERHALVSGCRDAEGLCVRYTVRAGSAVAAAMLGAAGLAAPAFAETPPPPVQEQPAAPQPAPAQSAPEASLDDDYLWGSEMIIVGGLRKPAEAQWRSGDKPQPQRKRRSLPVITEPAAPATKA